MEGKKQSFFKELRKIAAHMDRGTKLCKNFELDYHTQAKCLTLLKGYTEEVQEKLDKSKEIYQEQDCSLMKFQTFLELVEDIIDQQKEVLESQESYMEQYGYVPYEETCSKKEEKTDAQEPECVSSPKENVSPSEELSEEVPADREFPRMPRLEDFSLSHHTILELQRLKNFSNRPTIERVATPTVFQHDGLFMSPGVLGKMPSLYTPDVENSLGWPESVVVSARKSAFLLSSAKKIRKNLQIEMNNEDPDILNRCPSAPSLSVHNSQNFNLDIYQLPSTPKFSKLATPKPAEISVSKRKDYMNEEIPQPPEKFQTFNRKCELDTLSSSSLSFQSSTSSLDTLDSLNVTNNPVTSCKSKSKRKDQLSYFDMDVPKPPMLSSVYDIQACSTKPDTDTPSPPLLHSTLSHLDPADSLNITSRQVLSCKSKKNKKQLSYFDMDVPEAPKLSRSTRNKENQPTKT